MAETAIRRNTHSLLSLTERAPPGFLLVGYGLPWRPHAPACLTLQTAMPLTGGQWEESNLQVLPFNRDVICPPRPLFFPLSTFSWGVDLASPSQLWPHPAGLLNPKGHRSQKGPYTEVLAYKLRWGKLHSFIFPHFDPKFSVSFSSQGGNKPQQHQHVEDCHQQTLPESLTAHPPCYGLSWNTHTHHCFEIAVVIRFAPRSLLDVLIKRVLLYYELDLFFITLTAAFQHNHFPL